MHIALDLSSATPSRTGIGTYAYELARRMLRSRDHQFTVFFNSLRQPLPRLPELQASNVKVRRWRIPGPLLLKSWQRHDFPCIETLTGRVDVFHAMATYIPPRRETRCVVTVHDLSFFEPDADTALLGGGYLAWVCRNRLAGVDAILANSPATQRTVEQFLAGQAPAPDRNAMPAVHVTPLGVDERFFEPVRPERLEAVRRRYKLPPRYLLNVGTREPRKSLPLLLEAYRLVLDNAADTPPLVMAGGAAWREEEFHALVRKLDLARHIHLPGFIPFNDLPAIYRGAAAFLFPSRLEGFGLPVLEAMASEVPVVCSPGVAVVELIGEDAVVLFREQKADVLASALQGLLGSSDMARRLSQGGPTLARQFTWAQCVTRTLAAYESLA